MRHTIETTFRSRLPVGYPCGHPESIAVLSQHEWDELGTDAFDVCLVHGESPPEFYAGAATYPEDRATTAESFWKQCASRSHW